MQPESLGRIEQNEIVVSEPILLDDTNSEALMNDCLPLLNQFAPESATISFFTDRNDKTYVTLVKTKTGEIVGVSGFKIDQPKIKNRQPEPLKVLYRSFTFIGPQARGGGQYNIIQEKVQKIAKQEGASYQVLRTQNGRVWETATKSFAPDATYPNQKNNEIPEEVQAIAQSYNMVDDSTPKPMKGLVAISPFYAQLAPVERKCRDQNNTEFLEELFRDADSYFKQMNLVDKDKEFGGIESAHPYSIMVVSRFPNQEKAE